MSTENQVLIKLAGVMNGGKGYDFPLPTEDPFLNIIVHLIDESPTVTVFVQQVFFLRNRIRDLRDLIPSLKKFQRGIMEYSNGWEVDDSSYISKESDLLIISILESCSDWDEVEEESLLIISDCTKIIKKMDEISISQLDLSRYF